MNHNGQLDMFETGPAGILRPVVNRNSTVIPEALSRPGQSRGEDPQTSKVAAGLVKAKAGSARVLLLGAYIGVEGLTDEEAADRAGVSLLSEYATRVSELVRYQMLEPTGEERLGRSGVSRRVCRITDYGRHVMGKRNNRAVRIDGPPRDGDTHDPVVGTSDR